MALGDFNVFIAAGFVLGTGVLACAPTESAGECTATKACTARGEVCDVSVQQCVAQDLSVDATDEPTPASFADVALPFFRGKVCMPLKAQPGDRIPVEFSPCLHPCMTAGGYLFKQQYTCTSPAYCEAAVVQFFTGAAGSGCPADAFGSFDRSQCVYADKPIPASVGPFVIDGGAIRGNAQAEVPFLSNDDTAAIRDGAGTSEIWELIKQYPQSGERVFPISLDGANPKAPADCSDPSLCDCREIGF